MVICQSTLSHLLEALLVKLFTVIFSSFFFSYLSNCITHYYPDKGRLCGRTCDLKKRWGKESRGKATEPRDRGEGEGRQGFQINYWSGVRWTFNLTNQLPNYRSVARLVYPMHWCVCVCVCVCSWLELRVEVLL